MTEQTAFDLLKPYLEEKPRPLIGAKTIQLLLIREIHDYTVLRTEETRETEHCGNAAFDPTGQRCPACGVSGDQAKGCRVASVGILASHGGRGIRLQNRKAVFSQGQPLPGMSALWFVRRDQHRSG